MTTRDIEQSIDSLIDFVGCNSILFKELINMDDWHDRRKILLDLVNQRVIHSNDGLLNEYQFAKGEWFFYELQETSGLDFGFCPHFIENYKTFLTSEHHYVPTFDTLHKCNFGDDEMYTTCTGDRQENCVHINVDIRKQNEDTLKKVIDLAEKSFNAYNN